MTALAAELVRARRILRGILPTIPALGHASMRGVREVPEDNGKLRAVRGNTETYVNYMNKQTASA